MQFSTQTRQISEIMQDDWFRLAGSMYRVSGVRHNKNADTVTVYYYDPENHNFCGMLVMPTTTKFEFHNQL